MFTYNLKVLIVITYLSQIIKQLHSYIHYTFLDFVFRILNCFLCLNINLTGKKNILIIAIL